MKFNNTFYLGDIFYYCKYTFVWKKEIWKDIKGYEGIYMVSSIGRIKSLKFNKQKILSLNQNDKGYLLVNLRKDKKSKSLAVHVLVSVAFLNHIPNAFKLVVNHKDFNSLNNFVSNLEIVTQRTNSNKKHLKSTSKYTGVNWSKTMSKWRSSIVINGKKKHLGYFDKELEASIVYEKELKLILDGKI